MVKLSICFPTFLDFDGLYFSAIDIPISHPEIVDQIEVIVVDNDPGVRQRESYRKVTKSWVENYLAASIRARYVHHPSPVGPASAKQRCFDEASAEFVLLMDCHVRIASGGISRLIRYLESRSISKNLYSGPMVYDTDILRMGRREQLKNYATHMEDRWRGHDLGTWASDIRGSEINNEPFEVPMMGCGVLACRKETFVGFNPNFRGFGAEESYLFEKTRQNGGSCICLPFLRWVHRFARPLPPPYPLRLWDKVRNYVIGHRELGIPIDGIHQNFCITEQDDGRGGKVILMNEDDWNYLIEDPIGHVDPPGKPGGGCTDCGGKGATILDSMTLDYLYNRVSTLQSDIVRHIPKLRELASKSDVVVEFGHRRGVSTVGLLAGQPKKLFSYDIHDSPIRHELKKKQGECDFSFIQADVTHIDIPECDLLFEDSRHTAEHIETILNRHAGRVRRWMAFHDTQIFGETGEDGNAGILVALRKFMREHPEWSVIYHTQENYGFTVLSKCAEDKPPLPSLSKMAWNYAKALIRHQATGARTASVEVIKARLDVCVLCDQRSSNRCSVCGCFLDEGPNERDGKALWVDSECPLGKWEGIQQ